MVSLWEHEFDQVKEESELQNFIKELEFQDPLNPREALYGGRTNATRLYCCEGGMRYVDVCSLYRAKVQTIPVGNPEIITKNFEDVRSYFGLVQCRVVPPPPPPPPPPLPPPPPPPFQSSVILISLGKHHCSLLSTK